ncbi:CDP-alcohol phosphatidyltransferase family protein [Alkalicoccobacillus plakortidis]|uniref:CDP-alcohol phosphatidyltransferase family protein n=1 Tax=Alkalicoccobacillus plakortidis TaxID=444060 RepID=A0ABT0XK35_9BACI|nr:CDP-alcohol phosphatidyltransferase family protein [Alkalicoccobacillus plakortidis]MCM2675733.1 CDP-alcohol phosphatidyltransferase family protein [Alkalicoccobacillus plakortidis]
MSSEKLSTFFFDSERIIELRRQVQPYSAKEDLWSWYVLRRMSIYITILFEKMRLTPNAVSWLSVLFVLLSGLFMVMATPTSFILAFVAYNLGYLFDCVDGELARMTKKNPSLDFL